MLLVKCCYKQNVKTRLRGFPFPNLLGQKYLFFPNKSRRFLTLLLSQHRLKLSKGVEKSSKVLITESFTNISVNIKLVVWQNCSNLLTRAKWKWYKEKGMMEQKKWSGSYEIFRLRSRCVVWQKLQNKKHHSSADKNKTVCNKKKNKISK